MRIGERNYRQEKKNYLSMLIGLSLICFFFLPIMLFGNAQFFTNYAQNYARESV